jgi:uncharacterized protein YegP (UPF0339 family)
MKTANTILSALTLALTLAVGAAGCATAGDENDALDEASAEAAVRVSFDLWQSDNGEYYFHVAAGNGAILLASEGYQTRMGALGGILSVLDNGGIESRYTIKKGADGDYYVSLKAANGEIIAVAEGYSTSSNARRAIRTCTRSVGAYLEAWANPTGARFDVFEGHGQDFYFNLHAQNGEIVLQSEGYTTEAAALNGAFSVAENGVDPANYEILASADGGAYLNLHAANGEIIATSEVYDSKSNAVRARDAIIALLPTVELL